MNEYSFCRILGKESVAEKVEWEGRERDWGEGGEGEEGEGRGSEQEPKKAFKESGQNNWRAVISEATEVP